MSKICLKVKAVIFDMDGVITHTMPDHYKAWKAVLKEEGVNVTFHDIYSREGQRGIHSVKEIFAKYGIPFSLSRAKGILRKKEEYFKKIVKNRFVRGARRFLKGLHRIGFSLGLVTGTSRHELQRILPGLIYNLFSVIITGTDVVKGKPHPEPFLKAIKHLKVNPKDAVVIENAPLGISSAKKAGLLCIALETSLAKEYLREADYTFHSIGHLEKNIKLTLKK